jgi:hypothetical protein
VLVAGFSNSDYDAQIKLLNRGKSMKILAAAILFATFAFAASASTMPVDSQRAHSTEAKSLQLAQQGGVFCKKGFRWDHRQRTCVR